MSETTQSKTHSNNNLWKENKKYLSLLLILLSAYVVFHIPIERYILDFLVDKILQFIPEKKWYMDLIFLSVLTYTSYSAWKSKDKRYYLTNIHIYLFTITLIYLANRFFFNWKFYATNTFDFIYYSDIIVFISFICIIHLIYTAYNNCNISEDKTPKNLLGFITDKPITNIEDDKLQYSNYAQSIAEKIITTNAEKSFAIGVNGKWGAGKTSFFNLIKKKLETEKKEIIIIDFSPWNTENPKAIMADFFETMEEKLGDYHSNISRKISTYSKKLQTLNDAETTKPFFGLISDIFSTNKTLSQLKSELEKTIKSINQKIIIFIDDVDRLDNVEIIEVLRLIRNTADFKNTFFIVGYDRNYVINSISQYNSYNKEGFLEKIFQLEINLPHFEKELLIENLRENLTLHFPDKAEVINYALSKSKLYAILSNINTLRDIVLLSNTIVINYENLKGNVNLHELLYLEILRIKYPTIYDIIRAKNTDFIAMEDSNSGIYQLLTNKNDKNIYTSISKRSSELNINIFDLGKIRLLLEPLFDKNNSNFLSMINSSKYENYFLYRLSNKTLSENEFIATLKQDINILLNKTTEWIDKGYEFDLLKRLSVFSIENNVEEYKKIIQLIFYIGRHKSKKNDNIIAYDASDLYRKTNRKSWFENKQHKQFLISIFENGIEPYSFETDIIYSFLNYDDTQDHKSLLTIKDLLKISITFLDNYVKVHPIITNDLIKIIKSNAIIGDPILDPDYVYNVDFKTKIFNYLSSQKIEDIIKIFLASSETNSIKSYMIKPLFFSLFNNKEQLITYFEQREVTKSELHNEFLLFLKINKKGNHYISYDFKHL